jgi:selenide,water dikinase
MLLLTKPIGTGVVTTALKQQHVVAADLDVAVQSMLRLNGTASKILREFSPAIHACTDITGFGLLGHAWEMAEQSSVRFNLHVDDIPVLPGAREYAAAGFTPGGTDRNASYLAPHVSFGERVSAAERLLLFDPQTSGGLFVAVGADQVKSVLGSFAAHDVPCFVVGSVVEGEGLIVE